MVSVNHKYSALNRQLMTSVLARDKKFALEIILKKLVFEGPAARFRLFPNREFPSLFERPRYSVRIQNFVQLSKNQMFHGSACFLNDSLKFFNCFMKIIEKIAQFLQREWFLLVMVSAIAVIVLLFEAL